jgi:3-oxoacyl-[acyl-carrier protein] reductase
MRGKDDVDLRLAGKRALVTGSNGGLGEAIVRLLATEGADVVVHGRNRARATAVATSIRASGAAATVAIGDLGTDDGAQNVTATALAGGAVDILVNNAGACDRHKGWTDATPADWTDLYDVNVLASVRLIGHLVPAMRERRWGRVIQIGSVVMPSARQPHYSASSAARENLSGSLARELRESGVTSNTVATGGIARPDEIAGAVAYLASPVADSITGVVLRLDGNWYCP